MGAHEHHARAKHSVACAILTVSDTRTPEPDASGTCIRALLEEAGHRVTAYSIVADEPRRIRARLDELLADDALEAIIVNGGTGLAPRDTTYDTIVELLDK